MSYIQGFGRGSLGGMATLQAANGMSIGQAMSQATKELKQYLKAEIEAFYASYSPVANGYNRTGALRDVFKNAVAKGLKYDASTGTVKFDISYNLNKAAHKSWDGGKADVVKLLNYGYVTKGKPKKLPYARNGFYFIDRAVEKFNTSNNLGVTASATPFKQARNDYRL